MVKRYYFILFFLLVFQNIVSQADTDYVNNNEDPFLIFKCESMPVFKGNLSLFVQDQVQFPSKALIDSVENVVIVSFLVDTTGNTIEHAIVKGLEDEFNTEALRVAKLVKFEKPAMQSGKPVKVKYTIPIKFIPPKQDEKESFNNGIELNLSFDKNPVFLGDSLELRLTYRNRTSEVIDFYPEACIGLFRHDTVFISYETAERIGIILNNVINYDSLVILKPNEEYECAYKILVDSSFFYLRENEVYFNYYFFDKPKGLFYSWRWRLKPKLSAYSSNHTIIVLPPKKIISHNIS